MGAEGGGEPPIEDTSCHLADRFDRTSRPIIMALLKSVRPGRRVGPVRVTLNGREAKLCGWTLGSRCMNGTDRAILSGKASWARNAPAGGR